MSRVVCERCGERTSVSVLNPDPECGECGASEFVPPRQES